MNSSYPKQASKQASKQEEPLPTELLLFLRQLRSYGATELRSYEARAACSTQHEHTAFRQINGAKIVLNAEVLYRPPVPYGSLCYSSLQHPYRGRAAGGGGGGGGGAILPLVISDDGQGPACCMQPSMHCPAMRLIFVGRLRGYDRTSIGVSIEYMY